jgi:O-antigen/teichoic acid export membrane protein
VGIDEAARSRTWGFLSLIAATLGALFLSLPFWIYPRPHESYPFFDTAVFIFTVPIAGVVAIPSGLMSGRGAARGASGWIGLVLGVIVALGGCVLVLAWLMQDTLNETL